MSYNKESIYEYLNNIIVCMDWFIREDPVKMNTSSIQYRSFLYISFICDPLNEKYKGIGPSVTTLGQCNKKFIPSGTCVEDGSIAGATSVELFLNRCAGSLKDRYPVNTNKNCLQYERLFL